MLKPSPRRWTLLHAALLAVLPAVGCGADPIDSPDVDVEQRSAALTSGQSYLVSFTSGGIPANAGSLVSGAAAAGHRRQRRRLQQEARLLLELRLRRRRPDGARRRLPGAEPGRHRHDGVQSGARPAPADSFFYQQAAGYDGQIQDCSIPSCPTYAYVQGTSAAAPHVTGVAALAISKFGKMSPEQLLARLSLAANPLPCPPSPYDPLPTGQPATCKGPTFYDNFYPAGEVDALATLK
jgi:hypothetical protein